MTLPDERYRAVIYTRDFLRDLLDKTKTPRISTDIRVAARMLLKHYPNELDMGRVAAKSPDVFEVPQRSDKVKVVGEI